MFDKLTYAGNLENLAPVADSPRLRFVRGDICSAADLDAALPGHDVLVNFAAESHVDRSIVGAADFIQTNVFGAQQVFEAALRHGVGRVVHISTDEVYGSIDEGSWREDHLLEPNSPYSAAKAGSDLIARAYAKSYGLNISITRCSNNYGPVPLPREGHPAVRHQPAGRAARCRSTAPAPMCATGCSSPTTAAASSWWSRRARRASSTTSAAAASCPTGS